MNENTSLLLLLTQCTLEQNVLKYLETSLSYVHIIFLYKISSTFALNGQLKAIFEIKQHSEFYCTVKENGFSKKKLNK